jgi:CPA2 family monovalent cation:H+ antiporter-2
MLVDPDFVIHNLPLLLATLVLIVVVKGALVALPAALLGTPTRTAVLTGAILAQSAEFSFLLAQVGRDLEAISSESFALMLAGAAASIVLLPGVFAGSHPLAAALGERRASFRGGVGALDGEDAASLSGHAIIAGYGRVGEVIAGVIGERFPIVAIEEDVRVAERLRAEGMRVVQGNAAVTAVFEQAQPARARVLVIAIPEPVAVRQLVDYVEETYPLLDTVVRTHSVEERRFLMQRGVDEVVLAEWELALEMLRHTLGSFRVDKDEIQDVLSELRASVDLEPRDAIRGVSQQAQHGRPS